MDDECYQKYRKYKRKYLTLVCNQLGGCKLTPYAFFMHIQENNKNNNKNNNKKITDTYYLFNISSFTQIKTFENKLITIIGKKYYNSDSDCCGCLSFEIYANILVHNNNHKTTHVLIDSQIDTKNTMIIANKINQSQNFHIIYTSDIFSHMLNNKYEHTIILLPEIYVLNLIDSVKHMKQLFSSKSNENSVKINSSYF